MANTTKGSLVRIPILADGGAGKPEDFIGSDSCPLAKIDGITPDGEGGMLAMGNDVNTLKRLKNPRPSENFVEDSADGDQGGRIKTHKVPMA